MGHFLYVLVEHVIIMSSGQRKKKNGTTSGLGAGAGDAGGGHDSGVEWLKIDPEGKNQNRSVAAVFESYRFNIT